MARTNTEISPCVQDDGWWGHLERVPFSSANLWLIAPTFVAVPAAVRRRASVRGMVCLRSELVAGALGVTGT